MGSKRSSAILITALILVTSCDRTGPTKTVPATTVSVPDASAPVTSPAVMEATNEEPMVIPGVEVLVSCVSVRSTGKRHNSFFFTFRIEQEIRGELGQAEYTSQEIYFDFGAGQIVQKLGLRFGSGAGSGGFNVSTPASCARRGVLKLVQDPDRDARDASTGWRILWVAREDEADSSSALERVAAALISAVERKDLEPVRPHLAPESNLTHEQLLAIARAEEPLGPGSFTKKVYAALLSEGRGIAWIGGGGTDYRIPLTHNDGGAWTIGRIDWR